MITDQSDDLTGATLILDWTCVSSDLCYFHISMWGLQLLRLTLISDWDERLDYYLPTCFYLLNILLRLDWARNFMIGS